MIHCIRSIALAAVAVAMLALPATTGAQQARSDTLGAALHAYLQRAVHYGMHASFLVARNGRIIVHDGFGLADREAGVPLTAETVFDIGSITKQFTAAAIMKLEEQGTLRVTDSLGRFFRDVPEDKRGITIHHLLSHQAGFVSDLGGDYQVMPRDSVVRGALASELEFQPGAQFEYSNLGYSLLGAIVEIVSGQPYERFLHEHLFQPAGMRKTGYRIPTWEARELAVGYRGDQRWGTPLDHAWADDGPWWNLRANGGILSTMGDLYRWHAALQGGTVLSDASLAKLYAKHADGGFSHYGYGWAVFDTPRGTRLIAHNGGNGYFYADFLRFVDEDATVILATNESTEALNVARERLTASLFNGAAPRLPPTPAVQLAPAELERYAGAYALPSGGRIVVAVSGGRLVADPVGQDAVELLSNFDSAALPGYRALTARAVAIFDAVGRGDFTVLREASASPDRAQEIVERIRRNAEENMGAYRSVEILGSGPSWWSQAVEPVTFVRLHFERGTRLFRLHWEDGRISGFGGMAIPNPARATLQPQGQHRFTGYNLGVEYPVNVRFLPSGGRLAAIAVGAAGQEVRAARIPD